MGRYHQTKEKTSGGLMVLLVIMLIAFIAAGWFYFNQEQAGRIAKSETQPLPLPPAADAAGDIETPADKDIAAAQPEPGNAADEAFRQQFEVLPDLDASDGFIREELLKLSPGLERWLTADQLIRKFMVIVNDFSEGSRLEKHMRFLRPDQPFSVDQDQAGMFIAEQSYRRYDPLAAAINALDADATVALYNKIRPLLMQVFAEFSYPEGYRLDDIFTKAAAEILAAPVIDGRVGLVRPSVHYKFADAETEALNPVRKQMLRMGPGNTRIIQNKVRRLVEGLADARD